MKTSKILTSLLIGGGFLVLAAFAQAQTPGALPVTGLPIVVNGQTFLLTLNSNGTYTTTARGPNGSAAATVPATAEQAVGQVEAIINANNPANTNFYNATEWEARLGGVYEQNSGESAALIGVIKWQPVFNQPVGFEAALLQGNQSGQSGTAGAYGAVDYRKIIGDVAAVGGIGGGYDNYNTRPFMLAKGGVEYRMNAHLGSWVDLNYALESKGNATRGFGFAAGLSCIF